MWFDLAITPFFLLSFYFLYTYCKDKKSKNVIGAGTILGLALLIKLSAILVIAPLALYILYRYRQMVWYFGLSVIISFLLGFLAIDVVVDLGSLNEIGYWGVYYPLFVMARMPGYIRTPTFSQFMRTALVFLPFVTVLPLIFKKQNEKIHILAIFFLASLLFSAHRFDYFHLQPAIPFFVLLLGYGLVHIQSSQKYARGLLIGTTGLSFALIAFIFALSIHRNWNRESRFFDTAVYDEATQLKTSIPPAATAYFHNTPSQYMVASGILPVKPWADTFPWYMELPGMQDTIISSMEKETVEWVIVSEFLEGDRYDLGVYNPSIIDDYIHSHFDKYREVNERITIFRRK